MNLLPIVFSTLLAATPLGPGDHSQTLRHDGLIRSYLVHVPRKYDPQRPTPVLLVFHGAMTDAAITVRLTGINEKADREGFMAVYPNGTGRIEHMLTWNAGNCCGAAEWNKVDDVGFTRAMLDDLAKVANVDTKRVFATGISNGGMMCYRLASELSDRIAAIAPVAGTMGLATCNPKRAVSVMHFHGTDDKFVPFKGGTSEPSLALIELLLRGSFDPGLGQGRRLPGETRRQRTKPKKVDDGTTVQRKTYGPGKDGAEVILFVIHGGGHTWPGRDVELPVPRQIDEKHLGQRPDVGVLQAASDEMRRQGPHFLGRTL